MSFKYIIYTVLVGAALFLVGCSLIDEDYSGCETDFQLDYQLRLVTNITTELETQLGLEADVEMNGILKDYLKDIFTDYARDVDLSFYDTEPPMVRLNHMQEVMNGSESNYTLYLPVRKYRHTAVANILNNDSVTLEGDEECATGRLAQVEVDGEVPPHATGLFTARKDIDVLSGKDQRFDVRLYMANAATALVVDWKEASTVKDLSVTVSGFASGFNISDSTYVFAARDAVMATRKLETDSKDKACFVSVHFPSHTEPGTKASDTPLWSWTVHAFMQDGTVTESVIHMYNPLLAGNVKILNAKLQDTGIVTTADPTVGVSVTLDWHAGDEYNTDL